MWRRSGESPTDRIAPTESCGQHEARIAFDATHFFRRLDASSFPAFSCVALTDGDLAMPSHDYSPREALDLLLQKVKERAPELGNNLQSAIDAGKDVSETEITTERKKPRTYRKTVPLTDEEALLVVINSLRAYFVEQPLFANSAILEFADAALAAHPDPREFAAVDSPLGFTEGVGLQKQLQVELQTETQISEAGEQTARLPSTAQDTVEEQQANLKRLLEALTFDPK